MRADVHYMVKHAEECMAQRQRQRKLPGDFGSGKARDGKRYDHFFALHLPSPAHEFAWGCREFDRE